MSAELFVFLTDLKNKEPFQKEFLQRHNPEHHPREPHDMIWIDVAELSGMTEEEHRSEYGSGSFWSVPCHWDSEHVLDCMVLAAQVLHDLGIWGKIEPSPMSDAELPR